MPVFLPHDASLIGRTTFLRLTFIILIFYDRVSVFLKRLILAESIMHHNPPLGYLNAWHVALAKVLASATTVFTSGETSDAFAAHTQRCCSGIVAYSMCIPLLLYLLSHKVIR